MLDSRALSMATLILNDLTLQELAAKLQALDIAHPAPAPLFARAHAPGATVESVVAMPGLSRAAAATLLRGGARLGRLVVRDRQRAAADNFAKYLFTLEDGRNVEAVRIPLPAGPDVVPEHYVICVSTQAGCALGCAFCATGKLGFGRNLEPWEIVEQVARIRDEADHPIRGVVFMGMGEPFLNYDAVLRAAEILAEPAGFAIARKAMTISTAGVVPGIRRFVEERRRHRLAISLTSAIEEKRRELMPIEKRYPLAEVLAAARCYCDTMRERVVIEYVMVSGVNVGREDAAALIERLQGLRVRLNLIDVNDTSGAHLPPTEEELRRFRDWLTPLGQPIVRRYSGGKEIAASCGMLAGRVDREATASP